MNVSAHLIDLCLSYVNTEAKFQRQFPNSPVLNIEQEQFIITKEIRVLTKMSKIL